ncbi:MAG: hypothetical protein RSG54_10420 [Clostridium sp.]
MIVKGADMKQLQFIPQRSNKIHPINRLRRKLQNAEEQANTYLQLALAEIPDGGGVGD